MLSSIKPEQVLFLDIETVPYPERYDLLPENMKRLWDRKTEQLLKNDRIPQEASRTPEDTYERAGIYAEFGKIICISTGFLADQILRMKSFWGDDEKDLLVRFSEILNRFGAKGPGYLCAHNGKEFDYPYLIRRMLINGLPVPSILDLSGKKPWEVNHLDTMDLWKFGDYKSYTSLELLATVLGIPTPKDDIEGKDVARVYWQDHDIDRIVRYCQRDVLTVANIFLRIKGGQVIGPNQIHYVA